MTYWPEPDVKKLAPEGHYEFRLNREPELRKFTDTKGRDSRRLILYVTALGDNGEFQIVDSFVPWEPRYGELCKALGVEHGKDIEMAGGTFEADIKHEPRKDKPGEVWPRIANIIVPKEEEKATEGGDDIPF